MLQSSEGSAVNPTLDPKRFRQIFRRWNNIAFLLEEAVEVPRDFVVLVHQDLPLLLREVAQARPDLCYGQPRMECTG